MIKMAFKTLEKNLVLNIVCFIQIFLCLLLLNLIILLYYNFNYIEIKTAEIFKENVIVFSGKMTFPPEEIDYDYLKDNLQGLRFIEDDNYIHLSDRKKGYDCHALDNNYAYFYKPKLASGRWFDGENKTENIPIIVKYGISEIGDVIVLENYMSELKCEVIGVLDDNALMIATKGISVPITYDSFYSKKENYADIYILKNDIENKLKLNYATSISNNIAVFEKSLTSEQMRRNFEILNSKTIAYTKEMVKIHSTEKLSTISSYLTPIAISYTLVSILSLISFAFISNKRLIKENYIMRLSGISDIKRNTIVLFPSTFMHVIATILSAIIAIPIMNLLKITLLVRFSGYFVLLSVMLLAINLLIGGLINKKNKETKYEFD